MRVSTHGTAESILLARAISMAAALNGLENRRDGVGSSGVVGVVSVGHFKAGVTIGELKQSRYSAMKNSSFAAHAMKRTV
jgi:hypothetical protein